MIPKIYKTEDLELGMKLRLPIEQETRNIPFEVTGLAQVTWASAGQSFAVTLKNSAFGREITEIVPGTHEYVQYVGMLR